MCQLLLCICNHIYDDLDEYYNDNDDVVDDNDDCNDDDYDVVDYRSLISQLFTYILIVC